MEPPQPNRRIAAKKSTNYKYRNWTFPVHTTILSEILPNLENLTLFSEFDIGNNRVEFINLKHIRFNRNSIKSIGNLHLPRLELLDAKFDGSSSFNEWLTFYRNCPLLKKVRLDEYYRRDGIRLEDLMDVFPNLVEMDIYCTTEINPQVIIDFIEKQRKLTKFQFKIRRYDENEITTIRWHFKNHWKISDDSYDTSVGLILERENQNNELLDWITFVLRNDIFFTQKKVLKNCSLSLLSSEMCSLVTMLYMYVSTQILIEYFLLIKFNSSASFNKRIFIS